MDPISTNGCLTSYRSLETSKSVPLSFEAFKEKGFTPIHEKLLKGTSEVYIYFFKDKPVLLAHCDFLTKYFYDRKQLLGFLPDLHNHVNVLVKCTRSNKEEKEEIVSLDGVRINGETSKRQATEEERQSLQISFQEQLKRLGFCETALFEDSFPKAPTIQDNIRSCQSLIDTTNQFYEHMLEPMEKDHNQRRENERLEKQIESLKMRWKEQISPLEKEIELLQQKEQEDVNHYQLFIKEPQEASNEEAPKIFVVILKNNAVMKIFTTVYQADERKPHKILGDVIDVDSSQMKFTLEDNKQQRYQVEFQVRDNTWADYLTVWCEKQ